MAWGQRGLGIDDLVRRLEANDPSLQSLTLLRQRKLDSVQDVERLCAAIRGNTQLTELNVTAHAICTEGARVFAGLLAHNTTLRSLSVGTSQFGDAGMVPLAQGVAISHSLTSLDAENKGLSADSAAALAHALASCASLESLNLARNALQDSGIQRLCGSSWLGLLHLELQQCDVGAAGVAALAGAPGLPNLLSLSLASNQTFDSDAAPALQQLIRRAVKLRRLQVQHTRIGDAGITAVAQGLQPALQELDASSTGISSSGLVELARVASDLSRWGLRVLSLEGNSGVDDVGVNALCAAAPSCLHALHISATSITPAALQSIAHDLPALRSLGLLGCKLGSQGGAGVLAALLNTSANSGSCDPRAGVTASSSSPAPLGDAPNSVAPITGSPDQRGLPFPALEGLIVSATQLDAAGLLLVLEALSAPGAAPRLTSLEVGGNPGCEDEAVFQRVEGLRATRPELAVHWRSGDQAPPGSGGA